MKALGYRVVNPTSAQRKQHTAVAYGDRLIVHYGPSNGSGQYRDTQMGGRNLLSNKIRELFQEKTSASKGYTSITKPVQVVELNLAVDASLEDIITAFLQASSDTSSLSVNAACGDYNNDTSSSASAGTARSSATRSSRPTSTATAVETRAPRLTANGPVTRPNGELYRPRDIAGHADVALLAKMREININVRLFGPPGTGKTALAEAAYGDCITVNGHGDMTVAHFAGSLLPTPQGGWEWSDGPLTRAMKQGKMLFVDEITRIPTEVLAVLYSAMDGRNVLVIDDRPDIPPIHAAPGFGVIAGYNPDTLGARELDEALVSRFKIPVEVTSDFDMARSMGVPSKAIRLAKNLNTQNLEDRANNGPGIWVPQMRELLTFRDLVRSGMDESFAASVLVGSCPRSMDLPTLKTVAKSVFGYDILPLSVGGAAV